MFLIGTRVKCKISRINLVFLSYCRKVTYRDIILPLKRQANILFFDNPEAIGEGSPVQKQMAEMPFGL